MPGRCMDSSHLLNGTTYKGEGRSFAQGPINEGSENEKGHVVTLGGYMQRENRGQSC